MDFFQPQTGHIGLVASQSHLLQAKPAIFGQNKPFRTAAGNRFLHRTRPVIIGH
jgi:hypothetical protein